MFLLLQDIAGLLPGVLTFYLRCNPKPVKGRARARGRARGREIVKEAVHLRPAQ